MTWCVQWPASVVYGDKKKKKKRGVDKGNGQLFNGRLKRLFTEGGPPFASVKPVKPG